MKKNTILLLMAIILVVAAVITVGVSATTGRDKLKYEGVDEKGTPVIIGEDEIKTSLTSSKENLREDTQTVLATVNGKEITVYDLNITRTIQAFDNLEKEFTEKELLDIIIKDSVVYEYTSENGYVYKSDSEEAEFSGPSSEYDIYGASSGLDEKAYADMEYMVDKKLKTYSEYLDLIMDPILDGELGVAYEEYKKLYDEYKNLTETDSMQEIDWDEVNACTNELVELFTQHLVDEADVVIYEDRLN